jgi:hypothetical protein
MPVNAAKQFEYGIEADRAGENRADRGGGMNVQARVFADGEEAEGVIEIGIGQQNAGDGGIANRSLSRLKAGKGFDLRTKVGGCVDEEPFSATIANGD